MTILAAWASRFYARCASALAVLQRSGRASKPPSANSTELEYRKSYRALMLGQPVGATMSDEAFYRHAYFQARQQFIETEAIAIRESDAFREAIDFARSTPPWLRRVPTEADHTFLRDLKVRWEGDDES